jgi:hypothetical protein
MFSIESPRYNYLFSLLIYNQPLSQLKYFNSPLYYIPKLKLKSHISQNRSVSTKISRNMITLKCIVATLQKKIILLVTKDAQCTGNFNAVYPLIRLEFSKLFKPTTDKNKFHDLVANK